jgi:hypothetical protein
MRVRIRGSDNKNNVDPTVQAIVEMFPDDFLSAIRGLKRKYEEHAKKCFNDLVIQDSTIIN